MNDNSSLKLIDITGEQLGIKINRKLILSIVIPIVSYLLLSMLPLQQYGENCAKAVGFIVASILYLVLTPISTYIAGLLLISMATLLKLVAWSDVQAALGSSSFYPMLGMTIVALGAEFTPFGKRISYWALYKFGKKPIRLLVTIAFTTALISAFVSNTATIILMSSIMNGMLLAMGEKPGESKLGKVAMLLVLVSAIFGGIALINGSPASNNLCLNTMTSTSGDLNIVVTYKHWAMIAFPTFLLTFFPICFFYIKWFKIKDSDSKLLPPSYYKEHLDAIGKMTGAEWRWIIITLGMVVAMLCGMNNNMAAILFAAIALFPFVGVAPAPDVLKRIPWGLLLLICTVPVIGKVLNLNGVAAMVQDMISPLFGNMSPLAMSIALAVTCFLMLNFFVNAMTATWTFIATFGTTLCIACGYNPAVVLLPSFFIGAFCWCFGVNSVVLLNKSYGWWEMKDPIAPGFIAGAICCILIPVCTYLLSLLYGIPVTL